VSNSRRPRFVDKLHAILSDRSAKSIITWLPSGKAFVILDRSEFTSKILPRYMRETQFDSFSRRLKRWGFKKVYTTGTAHAVYCHELFQKDRLDLIQSMNSRTERDQRHQKINKGGTVSPSRGEAGTVDQMSLMDSLESTNNVPRQVQQRQQLVNVEVNATQVAAQPHGGLNMRSYEHAAVANASNFMAPPMMNYRPVGMAGRNASMISENHMYAIPAPVANHAVQANNMNQAVEMNFAPQPHDITRHSFTMGMQMPPPVNHVNMDAMMRVSAINEEIAACEEQLAILNRLRMLRERRRRSL
jgi:hypothetical protein